MKKEYIIVAVAVLAALLPALAAGHETDQYTVPLGAEFADLRFYFSNQVYNRLAAAVEKTNERIERSLRDGQITEKTERLHSPEVIAKAVASEFPLFMYHIESWESTLRRDEVLSQFPGLIVSYKPTFWVYHHPLLILDPTKLFRLKRTSTLMINGTYFGTDKLSHFFDMGYIYFKAYLKALEKGMSENEASNHAAERSAGGNPIFSESMILGKLVTGVRSNADLAADYAGLKFYRNLTEEVRINGKMQPPMLVLDGVYWKFNDHVGPHSDFFSIFISDHFDEALNPNYYILGMTTFVRHMVKRRCDDLIMWYHDDQGYPGTKEQFEGIAKKLSTYYGEYYGYKKKPDRMATVADTCFDNDKKSEENMPSPHKAAAASAPVHSNPSERAGINSADRFGRTALWWAARYGRIDEVKRLIGLGADVNAADIDGERPLHSAVRWGHDSVAEVLLEHGADVDARALYGITPLHMATRELQRDAIKVLLENGANVNAHDHFGWTPLHDVAARGDAKLAALLVAAGASPGAQDIHGTTPLHRAARSGNVKMVEKLLSSGAVATIRSSLGRTPLDEAIQCKDKEMIRYLRAHIKESAITLSEEQSEAR